MRIELSQTISQDERRSLGFPGVAQLLPGQPSHQILQDIRKFFGWPDIRRKLSHKPRPEAVAAKRSAMHAEMASDLLCEMAWDGVIDRIFWRRCGRTNGRVPSVPEKS